MIAITSYLHLDLADLAIVVAIGVAVAITWIWAICKTVSVFNRD